MRDIMRDIISPSFAVGFGAVVVVGRGSCCGLSCVVTRSLPQPQDLKKTHFLDSANGGRTEQHALRLQHALGP